GSHAQGGRVARGDEAARCGAGTGMTRAPAPGPGQAGPSRYNSPYRGAIPVRPVTLEFLTEQLELGDQLHTGKATMFQPQDLPGRYGRVVKAVDHLLGVLGCPSVLAGGWAVWHHGFVGRLTQDIDIVLPGDQVGEFLRLASVSGFDILPQPEGHWPKMRH